MLVKSDINPFDSQETKPYKNDPRIAAMTDLVDAYQRDDIHTYESILQNNQDVLSDPFIAENIDEVTRNMRTKAVLKLIAPYTRFTLAFVAKQLRISVPEVQDIVGFLIVDKKLQAKVNQENGTVEVESNSDMDRVQSMREWSAAIGSLWKTIFSEGEGFKSEESPLAASGFQSSSSEGGALQQVVGLRGANGYGKFKGGVKGKGATARTPAAGFK